MPLSIDKQIEELNELIQLDRDAVGAYTEALKAIHEPSVIEPLTRFRGDHERHISDLSALVRRLGGKPVEGVDFKGVARKTMTKVAGLAGVDTVLRAMKSNEEATNKVYAKHAMQDFPEDVLGLIRRNFDDERRHLAWVLEALRTRPWEHHPAQP